MTDLPTIITAAGLTPIAPVDIKENLLGMVEGISPGYTARLPGIMIEDIASTDVYAIVLCDSARVETVDSLSPDGANAYLLMRLGAQAGIPLLGAASTSVYVVFFGPVGFIIPEGFLVNDGVYTYATRDGGGIIGSDGYSEAIYCVATQPGSWAIAAGTVTNVASDLPPGVKVTCSNPSIGMPGTLNAETESEYRSRVLQAQRAGGLGMPSYLRTLVSAVPGVQGRLVAVKQEARGGWKVLVGGGDPYAVAYAILRSMTDISKLVGSSMNVLGISTGVNAMVTTDKHHGLTNGQTARINGITAGNGMKALNGYPLTVTVVNEFQFRTGIDTSNFGPWTAGGVVTPNPRNVVPIIRDYPDAYAVPIVVPPPQLVVINITWNTDSTNRVSNEVVSDLTAPAVAAYVNAVYVGEPLNLYAMQKAFTDAAAPALAGGLITRLVFAVSINGTAAAPAEGTGIIEADPESYFITDAAGGNIIVSRG